MSPLVLATALELCLGLCCWLDVLLSCRAACVDKHTRATSYWAFDLLDPSHLVRSITALRALISCTSAFICAAL
jgi:hypothetical protein